MTRKFFIATFGCRTNQADSAAIRQDFLDADFVESTRHADADVIVVNSCTVTHRTDQQVRQLARKLHRENPTARLVVTGCYAQRAPEVLLGLPGLTAIVGNTRKDELVRIAADNEPAENAGYRKALISVFRDDFRKVRQISLLSGTRIGGRTRPFVKIQDGCDAKCSYCIIPGVRGPSRSVPPDQVLAQIRALIDEGFSEIVLTGIHIGTYGTYLSPRFPLDELLSRILDLPGLGQIRLSSIEPMELSRRVVDLAAQTDKIAPHLHICLQSGSDRILRRMLRPYTTRRFLDLVESIREKLPYAAIGTDLVVGFPGESDEDHGQTLEMIERGPFTYLHVFPYSDRPGTRATEMPDKVAQTTIKRRSGQLRNLGRKKLRAFQAGVIGRELRVLTLTDSEKGRRQALTGNYLQAEVPERLPPNRLFRGRARAVEGGRLRFDQLVEEESLLRN